MLLTVFNLLQDSYTVTYQAVLPNGTAIGPEEIGCMATPPADKCIVSIDDSKYPPGTTFDVQVFSESDGTRSDPVEKKTNTSQ